MNPPRPLPALTIHQPWAHLIAFGEKPIENRDWNPPPQLLGSHLAIHAGKKVAEDAYHELAAELGRGPRPALWTGRAALQLPPPHELVVGAVVAVGRLVAAILTEGAPDGMHLQVRRVLGHLDSARAAELVANRYAFGPWLWVLEEVVRLPVPIPCRGAQKIWTVPDHEADLVRAGWARARTAGERSTTP